MQNFKTLSYLAKIIIKKILYNFINIIKFLFKYFLKINCMSTEKTPLKDTKGLTLTATFTFSTSGILLRMFFSCRLSMPFRTIGSLGSEWTMGVLSTFVWGPLLRRRLGNQCLGHRSLACAIPFLRFRLPDWPVFNVFSVASYCFSFAEKLL